MYKKKTVGSWMRLSWLGWNIIFNNFRRELSGGMQQRVAIARALAMQPDVILMDEPFAALDTFNRYLLQDELLRIQEKMKTTILIVTHDIDEAVYLSDRILIMSSHPGRIFQDIPINLVKPQRPCRRGFPLLPQKNIRRVRVKWETSRTRVCYIRGNELCL